MEEITSIKSEPQDVRTELLTPSHTQQGAAQLKLKLRYNLKAKLSTKPTSEDTLSLLPIDQGSALEMRNFALLITGVWLCFDVSVINKSIIV